MFNLFKSGLNNIRKALAKTRFILGDKISSLLKGPLNAETLDKLEHILFEADLGSTLAIEFVEYVRNYGKKYNHPIEAMKAYAKNLLHKPPHIQGKTPMQSPKVILVVGVNGSGKTTSCAKLACLYKEEGKKVLLAAGDTFRAAAMEQLVIWSERLQLDCIKGALGGDPSAIIFDALTAAKARGHDVFIADTAGRLHSKTNLMNELAKIKRATEKVIPDAPHEIYLVLDATTGQNALDQARTFNEFTPLTGLILTKLDGSAKGGIILSIYHQMGIPIRYIGIGEEVNDLIPFSSELYIDALFS